MAACYIAVQPSAEQHTCALLGHTDVISQADCAAAFKSTQMAAGFESDAHHQKKLEDSIARMLLDLDQF